VSDEIRQLGPKLRKGEKAGRSHHAGSQLLEQGVVAGALFGKIVSPYPLKSIEFGTHHVKYTPARQTMQHAEGVTDAFRFRSNREVS
jgi:hypothetical protein